MAAVQVPDTWRASPTAPQVPPMEWAQRKDSVYLTIKVPDLTNEKVRDRLAAAPTAKSNNRLT